MTDKKAILDELDALYPVLRPLQPGDIGIKDVQERFGCGRSAAIHWLTGHVDAGHLVISEAIDPATGRRVKVYRKVEA